MRTSIRRTLCATALAGGFTILGFAFATSSATAETPDTTSGAHGLASGNQTEAATKAPAKTSGNQVTVIGDRNNNNGSTQNGSTGSAGSGQSTTGEGGNGSGNQTDADANAPVGASDNQVTVIGDGNENSGSHNRGNAETTSGSDGGSNGNTTSGQGGSGSGNQTDAKVKAPVDASGNQVAVIGDGNDNASSNRTSGDPASGSEGDTTSGQGGTGAGNQTGPSAAAPVDATGNQATVIGDGNDNDNASESANDGATGNAGGDATNGQEGNGSGNQTSPTATAPLNATGNQLTVIGDGNTARSTNDSSASNDNDGDTTDGQGGTGSGNQTTPNATAPVEASSNQVTIIGDGNTTGGSVPADGGGGASETGAEPAGPSNSTSPPLDGGSGDGADGDSGGSTSAASATGLQAGPAAFVAGTLPQTGVAAGMLLWAGLGLDMLLLGLVLVASQRQGRAVRRRVTTVTPAM